MKKINRRQFIATASLAATAPFVPFHRLLARQENGFTALRRNVGIFVGQGGTIGWLATDDALVVVDTQFPDSAALCWEGLRQRTTRSIDLVINTHHHGDHTAGNGTLKPHASHIVAHKNVPILQKQAAERQGRTDEQVYADITFEDSWSRDVGDETVSLRYYGPAHTGGDSVIHFEKANVVHVGDLVFNRIPGYFDVPAGNSAPGWVDVLEKVYANHSDDTIFIFGHGDAVHGITGNRADLLVMRDYVGGLLVYVQEGIAAGKTVDEIAEMEGLPASMDVFYHNNQEGIARGIRAIYQQL